MYLFCINTIFIALSTFSVAKMLAFPLVKYANAKKKSKIKWTVTILAVLAAVPAVIIFLKVLRESQYEKDIRNFIKNEIEVNDQLLLSKHLKNYDDKTITLFFLNELSDATVADLRSDKSNNYKYIKDFKLIFRGSKIKSVDVITEAYHDALSRIDEKDNVIAALQASIKDLKGELGLANNKLKAINYLQVSKDAKIEFSDLKSISFAYEINSNFKVVDTVFVSRPKWITSLSDSLNQDRNSKLSVWLGNQVKSDTVYIK